MNTAVQAENIPARLKEWDQFLTWKRSKSKRKLPCSVTTGEVADAHDPASHGTFAAAMGAYQRRHHAGIGFDFTDNDPFTGIDLDDCVEDGVVVHARARAIIAACASCTEFSPSRTGVKFIV